MAKELKERKSFEAHMRVGGYSNHDKHPDGSYVSSAMELWWQGWKARAALAQSERVPAWIAVSERLPEPGTDVLAYGVNHRSHSYVVAGVFSGTWASQETEEATRFEPTHWMPLPAVPSAGSQGQGE